MVCKHIFFVMGAKGLIDLKEMTEPFHRNKNPGRKKRCKKALERETEGKPQEVFGEEEDVGDNANGPKGKPLATDPLDNFKVDYTVFRLPNRGEPMPEATLASPSGGMCVATGNDPTCGAPIDLTTLDDAPSDAHSDTDASDEFFDEWDDPSEPLSTTYAAV
eukprot:jgi/Mesvir1/7536/Mv19283-RA.1